MAGDNKIIGYLPLTSNTVLFVVVISSLLVIILSSSEDLFCSPKRLVVYPITNVDLFLIYSVVFTIVNVYFLKLSRLKELQTKFRSFLYLVIFCNQALISLILFIINGQIRIESLYYNGLFYSIIYSSLITSVTFSAIAGIHFIRWFMYRKNYLVLTYGLVMLTLSINSIIGIVYMWQVSLIHNFIIEYSSCSAMKGALRDNNPDFANSLSNVYDTTSFLSFILAWLVTASMLKLHSKNKSRFIYSIVIILPLIFFLTRYEVGLYYLLGNQAENILGTIRLSDSIYGSSIIENILNSNLQIGGALFGLAFFIVALNLRGGSLQKKSLIITGIGMMFLFGSKDIGTLNLSSYPPLGATSITLMGLASYMTYVGILSSATITARDNSLRNDLREKIENNMTLLRSISSSQHQIDIERNVKQVMKLSSEWKDDNPQENMSEEELKNIVRDVISEVKRAREV